MMDLFGHNEPPATEWKDTGGGDRSMGYRIQRLWVGRFDEEIGARVWRATDYQLQTGYVLAHQHHGYRHGLYKSGAHPSGCALFLRGSQRIAELKAYAEREALDG